MNASSWEFNLLRPSCGSCELSKFSPIFLDTPPRGKSAMYGWGTMYGVAMNWDPEDLALPTCSVILGKSLHLSNLQSRLRKYAFLPEFQSLASCFHWNMNGTPLP